MTPEAVKDVGFGSLVLPDGSVADSLAPSTLPAGNVFNPPSKAEPEEKVPHLIEHQIPSGENTRPGKNKSRDQNLRHEINFIIIFLKISTKL